MNPSFFSPINPHFFQPLLHGFHDHLDIPVKFFKKHIEGKDENKTAKLRSDVSYKTWEVKLVGRRVTDGWDQFADEHDLRIGDIVVFRHEGNMVFHVTSFGPSCCNSQHLSSSSSPSSSPRNDDNNSDELHNTVTSVKEEPRTEEMPSYDHTCFVGSVTAANLRTDLLCLPRSFARSNGLNRSWCEIILMNEEGRSWSLALRHKDDDQAYIRRGWRSFCRVNGLQVGCFFTFKLIRNGPTPVLWLFPTGSYSFLGPKECPEPQEVKEESFCGRSGSGGKKTYRLYKKRDSSSSSMQDRFVTLTLTRYNLRRGQLRLPKSFTRPNDIDRAGNSTLLGKNGVEWPTYIKRNKGRGFFYLVNGWRSFFEAHNVRMGEPFVLELIWEETKPVFKLCFKDEEEDQ